MGQDLLKPREIFQDLLKLYEVADKKTISSVNGTLITVAVTKVTFDQLRKCRQAAKLTFCPQFF